MQNKEIFISICLRKWQTREILLSGHHANIEKWRREQSIIRTLERRPELLEEAVLSKKEKLFLEELLRKKAENQEEDTI